MLIQKCKRCSNKFKYKQILWSNWKGYTPIECSKCNAKYKITRSSRLLNFIDCMVPMLLFFNYSKYHKKLDAISITYVIWQFLALFLSPFLSRYDYEE